MSESPVIFPDRVSVVLMRTRNPLNIGAVARAMANFGFADLRVVAPFAESWREARSAVGASPVLVAAREYATLMEAVADCSFILGTASISRRQPSLPVIALPSLSRELNDRFANGRIAIVFGSEKSGLSNDDFSHCAALLHIPTQPAQDSMNLGQAVAICLYEFDRLAVRPLSEAQRDFTPPPATAADRERLTQSLHGILQQTDYIKPGADQSILYQIREMLHRLHLSADDSHWLLGMLARIDRRLAPRNTETTSSRRC